MNVNDVLVERLATQLMGSGTKVVTAESCTGGWIAKTLTDIPGSSAWFEYGFVTYGNNAKIDMLGVDPDLLETCGAVSEEVVRAMAEGAAARAAADFSIAVSGIAGPDGGTPEKPVGTVWFAWRLRGGLTESQCQVFEGDRDTVRRQALTAALYGLAERIDQAR